MKDILFQQITVFNLSPPDQTASPAITRLYKHLTWLHAVHKYASYVLACIPISMMVLMHKPSGMFKIFIFVMLLLAFMPSVACLASTYLYNTKRYTAARWAIYSTLLPLFLELGFLGYAYAFVLR
ncbi:MAG: hypothetical protein KBD24_01405 [Candidatus Pacebacteria bacterium]|nr:hypothetical protein [Candidatus Paceibacterota bacterium]